jgi:hypothetical protein
LPYISYVDFHDGTAFSTDDRFWPYFVQVANPGPKITGVFFQTYVVQNGVRRPTGGWFPLCGDPGTLARMSTCTHATGIENSLPSLFVPGAALFEIILQQRNIDNTIRELDRKTQEIYLY